MTLKRPHFLNVDLQISSKNDLKSLARELGRRVLVLYCGRAVRGYLLALETARNYKNPDRNIAAFCALIEALSSKGKRAWRAAQKREFDIGYDAVPGQRYSHVELNADSIERICKVAGSVAVTFYIEEKSTKSSARADQSQRANKVRER